MPRHSLTLRPFTAEEAHDALDLLGYVFGYPMDEADHAEETAVIDPARSHAMFDGDTMVGACAAYAHQLSVPGGSVPCAGTTWVGVAPTHRRRGVMTRLISAHLDQARELGEPIAALWASEAPIYGRFGYGPATESMTAFLDTSGDVAFAETAPPAAEQVRVVALEEAAAVLDPIYEACRRRRGGMHARSPEWWPFQVLSTRPSTRQGAAFKTVAVAEVDGRDAAYAVYGTKERFTDAGRPDGTLHVVELAGVDAASEAAMWRFLADHDLMTSVSSFRRPVDDALPLLLADTRRVRRRVTDGLHVRVLDLPAALTARTWADSTGVTIEVADPAVAANDGTWRLEVAPEGASVSPSTEPAQLRMHVRAVGSMLLGGMSVARLAAAGHIEVLDPSVLGPLDAALRPLEAPWAPEIW